MAAQDLKLTMNEAFSRARRRSTSTNSQDGWYGKVVRVRVAPGSALSIPSHSPLKHSSVQIIPV